MLAKYVPKASISPLKEKNLPENPPATPVTGLDGAGEAEVGQVWEETALRGSRAFFLTHKLFHVIEINLQTIGRIRERMLSSRENSARMAGVNHQLPHMQDHRGQ